MRLLLRKPGLISLALMLPALFLSTADILSAFGVEAANHVLSWLDQTMRASFSVLHVQLAEGERDRHGRCRIAWS